MGNSGFIIKTPTDYEERNDSRFRLFEIAGVDRRWIRYVRSCGWDQNHQTILSIPYGTKQQTQI